MVKQKILKILKEGKKSTAEISSIINRNYYNTMDILRELREDKKITMEQKGKYIYWKLVNGK